MRWLSVTEPQEPQNGRTPLPDAGSEAGAKTADRRLYDDRGLERVIFFSDAVFAIAMTLLALEIRLPALPASVSNAELTAALGNIWPRYLSYGISFLVIGVSWMAHQRLFRPVCCYDRRLMLLNILFLLSISFLPFPTSVIGEYGDTAAGTIFYAMAMVVVGVLFVLLWWYVNAQGRLVERPLSPTEFRRAFLYSLWTPTIFLLSIPLAQRSPTLAKAFWLLIMFRAFLH
jgi:uncharacterized membrane protein